MSALLFALVTTATTACVSCPPSRGLDDGPVAVGFLDGGLGAARAAVPRSEVGIAAGGSVLADFDDFYGHLQGRMVAWASWSMEEKVEVSILIEMVRLETVISSLEAARLGFGTTTLGAMWRLTGGRQWDLSLGTRLVLPTDYGARASALPFGLDLGTLASVRVTDALEVHAHGIVLGSAQISEGPRFTRYGVNLGGGVAWHGTSWLTVAGDLAVMMGYDDPLDRLAVGASLRARVSPSWVLEVNAVAPLAGADRTQVAAAFAARLSLP